MRLSLSGQDWGRLAAMFGVIAALHVIGWGTLLLVVVPEHHTVGGTALGIGIGLTAYTLGLRHAFDADHIAAIDNTTRKLMADGQRPLSIGFWFSLGHSTIVFVIASFGPPLTRSELVFSANQRLIVDISSLT